MLVYEVRVRHVVSRKAPNELLVTSHEIVAAARVSNLVRAPGQLMEVVIEKVAVRMGIALLAFGRRLVHLRGRGLLRRPRVSCLGLAMTTCGLVENGVRLRRTLFASYAGAGHRETRWGQHVNKKLRNYE